MVFFTFYIKAPRPSGGEMSVHRGHSCFISENVIAEFFILCPTGALLYGLLGTCRLNGIDPEAYLRYILSVLPEWQSNKVAELLPWNVDLTNK